MARSGGPVDGQAGLSSCAGSDWPRVWGTQRVEPPLCGANASTYSYAYFLEVGYQLSGTVLDAPSCAYAETFLPYTATLRYTGTVNRLLRRRVDSVAGGVAGHCLRDSADALAPSHTPPSVPCTSPSRRGQLRKFVYLYRRVTSESKETRDLTLT
jgi:hypothetical protein